MDRETYQPPTASATRGGAGTDGYERRQAMTYTCGDCGNSVSLGKGASVICSNCSGRVLYKERTKR